MIENTYKNTFEEMEGGEMKGRIRLGNKTRQRKGAGSNGITRHVREKET